MLCKIRQFQVKKYKMLGILPVLNLKQFHTLSLRLKKQVHHTCAGLEHV